MANIINKGGRRPYQLRGAAQRSFCRSFQRHGVPDVSINGGEVARSFRASYGW